MKRSNRHKNLGFVLALALALGVANIGVAFAQDESGGVPGDWLSLYTTARTAGMGGAFVGVANEPTGILWNPAGLTLLDQNQFGVESMRLFESTSVNGFSFAMPARRFPSFGFTMLYLSSGDFEQTNDINQSIGTFSEGDLAAIFSASKGVGTKLSLGANVKIIRQTVAEFNANGVGFDLGLLYDVSPLLRVGASIQNIAGPSLTMRSIEESYPTELRGGVSLHLFDGRGLVSAELDYRDGPGTVLRGGAEFWVHNLVALRLGYGDESPGGGFSFRVTPDFRFDYAANDHELGVVHHVALSYSFGGFFASSKAIPPVFSPIGEQSVTKFQLQAKTKAEPNSWQLEIVDKDDVVVRRFAGKGVPPAHIMWDGKDEAGLPLPDGVYTYALTVIDKEGREVVGHKRTVEITTAGPQGAVPVFTD